MDPEANNPQVDFSLQEMPPPSPPSHELGQTFPTELIYGIISWVLSNSIHSICLSKGDVNWEMDVMNILCDVSPSFGAIAIEIAAKAFAIEVESDDDIDEEEERLLIMASLHEFFVYLHELDEVGNKEAIRLPYISVYALYIGCSTLRRFAVYHDVETSLATHQKILLGLERAEMLCDHVWPANMTDLVHNKIQDELEYTRAEIVIIESFCELDKHAESMIVLLPSRTTDGSGPLANVCSLIHESLSKFETVCGDYSRHLDSNNPPLDQRIYELPGVLPAFRKIYSLRFEEDEYNLSERIQKLVDLWIDGCPFLHKSAGTPQNAQE